MIKKYILGWLLHLANRDVKIYCKEQFYAIKKNLLTKYGTKLGEEIQHIRKECYSCDGTGRYKCDWKLTESCWSCAGTGVYEQYWTRLDKYKFGGYTFHNPTKKQYDYQPLFEGEALPVITGYIHHKTPKYRMADEALYWLLLIYDRKTLKKLIGSIGYVKNIRTPMVFLASIIFNIRHEKWKKEPDWKTERVFDDVNELPF